jgi:hypothetical protein
MRARDIETYLADLGQELHQIGLQQPVRLLLIGGAFMLTQLHSRRATNDVDVLLIDVDDPTTSPLYQTFKAAVRAVANRNRLPVAWMNDLLGDFLRDTTRVPRGTLWRTYALLEVYVPEAEYILALKLLAGRPKDRGDIQLLCRQLHVGTRLQAQQIVDRYIPDQHVQQLNHLDMTLSTLFP